MEWKGREWNGREGNGMEVDSSSPACLMSPGYDSEKGETSGLGVLAEKGDSITNANVPRWYISRRWVIVSLLLVCTTITYVNRVSLPIAIVSMAKEFGWTKTEQGLLLASFFYGYTISNFPGGWMANRFGGRPVLACAVFGWACATLLFPLIAYLGSFRLLIAARIVTGLCQGVTFPSIHRLNSQWIPTNELSRASSLTSSGGYLGTALSMLILPGNVSDLGWAGALLLWSSLSLIWIMVWLWFSTETPAQHSTIHHNEIRYIRHYSSAHKTTKQHAIPWGKIVRSPPFYALAFTHFCHNYGFYVIMSWLPTYFLETFNADLKDMGFVSVIPWLAMFAMANASGWVADTMLARGIHITQVRKWMQGIAFAGPALFLFLIDSVSSTGGAVLCMTGALSTAAFSASGFMCNHLDIGPSYAGVLLGLTNTFGSIPGIIGVSLTGYILDMTGSWSVVFRVAIALYVLGLLVWSSLATGEKLFN